MVLDGRGPTEVARDLDIPLSCLRRWKKDLLEKMDQGGAPGERSASDMAAEMDKLRRELSDMTVQRDILKKRYAYSTKWTAQAGGDRHASQAIRRQRGLPRSGSVPIRALRPEITQAFGSAKGRHCLGR